MRYAPLLPIFVVFLSALCWPGPNAAGALEPIERAFGLGLGHEFTPRDDPGAYTILDGVKTYHFDPEAPSPFFTIYLVQITPLTHLIHTVIAIGPGLDLETCRERRTQLLQALTARHGGSFTVDPPGGPAYETDYEIILQEDQKRGIGVTCGGDAEVILQVIYVDDVLSDLAESERRQMVVQSKR